jgi:putative spermidine/putrescine transport system permease protein
MIAASHKRGDMITTALLLLPGAGLILLLLGATAWYMFAQSIGYYNFSGASGFSFKYWTALFTKQFVDSFLYSVRIAFLAALVSVLAAYPLALLIRQSRLAQRLVSPLLKIPLFVPGLVAAFLILNILSYNGIINGALVGLGVIDRPLRMLQDPWGSNVVGIQVWKNIPFAFIIIVAVLQGIAPDLEEQAANLGATRWQIISWVVTPLAAPGLTIAFILIFITTFGDYAIMKLAGPNYPPALTVLMQTRSIMFQEWNTAACMAVVVVATSIGFIAAYTWLAYRLDKWHG